MTAAETLGREPECGPRSQTFLPGRQAGGPVPSLPVTAGLDPLLLRTVGTPPSTGDFPERSIGVPDAVSI